MCRLAGTARASRRGATGTGCGFGSGGLVPQATGAPGGWGWLALLGHADYLNLAAVALFGLVTLACYARIVPVLFAAGERPQAWIALAQVLVLAAAAVGIFTGGR